MTKIELSTMIHAPIERCFDLARNIDLHQDSMTHTGEKAIAGCITGWIGLNDTVTWRAKHLGIWQTLTSKITAFDYPNSFTDEMVKGAFKSMRHEHIFYSINSQTLMKDIFVFESPFGIFGEWFNSIYLANYMENLICTRNKVIKAAAEAI
jgi:ligand-binding SRPBCC domain-containing protein